MNVWWVLCWASSNIDQLTFDRMEVIMIFMVIVMIIMFSFYIAIFVQCIHNLLKILYKAKIKVGVKIMFCRILLLIIIACGLIRHYLPCIVTSKAVYWCADQTNLLTKHVYPTSRPDDGAICSSLNSTPPNCHHHFVRQYLLIFYTN